MEQKRFYLAMILSGAILLLWQVFLAPQPPEVAPGGEQTAGKTVDGDASGEQLAKTSAEGETADDQQGARPAEGEQQAGQADPAQEPIEERNVPVRRDTLAGEHLKVELTNEAASVVSAHILKPEQYAGEEPGDLVGFPEGAPEYPYNLEFLGKGLELPDAPVYEVVEVASVKGADGAFTKLVYRYDDPRGRFRIDKTFTVDPKLPYIVNMDVAITNTASQGRLDDTLALDILDWKDPNKESSFLDFNPITTEGVCKTTQDIEREAYGSLEEGPISFAEAQVVWGAVDTRYFMLAAIPAELADSCSFEIVNSDYVRTRIIHSPFSIEAGETLTLSHQLFMGPKDVDVLGEIGHNLTESVDYGIFAFIARPMRWALNWLFNLVGNWGLAIILLTFLIRGLLWPVNMKAYSSMERMKAVQPHLAELKEKYKDDRQRQTEETMKLFKKHNVSPAGGCLPMLLQMPVLYGLYVCIYNSVDLYNADFMLWYDNLAAPDPYFVLPILMGVAMVFQQRMSTVDTQNKQAQMMMKIMPIMFTAFMLFLPSGLVLYYALSLIIGVGQQYFIRKKFDAEPEPAAS
jgi:YidC/Oxa1 family membrane protein insertase